MVQLWSLLHSPFASLLSPNICLRILFSNTFSLCSSLILYFYNIINLIDKVALKYILYYPALILHFYLISKTIVPKNGKKYPLKLFSLRVSKIKQNNVKTDLKYIAFNLKVAITCRLKYSGDKLSS
jgi:hypothetical protein